MVEKFIEKPKVFYDDGQIKLFHNDFLKMDLSDYEGKINLIVTSPPYNVGIEYGSTNDNIGYKEYLKFTEEYLKRFYQVLADDGRVCLNIPLDKNKGGVQSVYADVVKIAKDIGLKYRSTIIWNEQNISRRTAWGSWLSASAPHVIAPVEMIVLLYKNSWKRKTKGKSTITRDEFIEWTNGIWTFPGEKRKAVNHPAPFPLELPLRCLKLFSYEGDIVLDPFVGSGTTMVACKMLNRKGIGIDIDEKYLKTAVSRIKNVKNNR
jgi:site-specific DNA-methyltransferase (adenine-specific)